MFGNPSARLVLRFGHPTEELAQDSAEVGTNENTIAPTNPSAVLSAQ